MWQALSSTRPGHRVHNPQWAAHDAFQHEPYFTRGIGNCTSSEKGFAHASLDDARDGIGLRDSLEGPMNSLTRSATVATTLALLATPSLGQKDPYDINRTQVFSQVRTCAIRDTPPADIEAS